MIPAFCRMAWTHPRSAVPVSDRMVMRLLAEPGKQIDGRRDRARHRQVDEEDTPE